MSVADQERARKLAGKLAQGRARLDGVRVYIGRVPSTSTRRLSRERQEAIRIFWETYLTLRGAEVEWATDGLGGLAQFVAKLNQNTGGLLAQTQVDAITLELSANMANGSADSARHRATRYGFVACSRTPSAER